MKHYSLSKLLVGSLLLLAPLCGEQLQAKNVDQATAKQVGAYFLASVRGEKSFDVSEARLVYKVDNPLLGVQASYTFNVPGKGFVVVAGSDCSEPIIAFSDNDTLDVNNMPPAFKWWIDGYSQDIINLQNAAVEAPVAMINEWNKLLNMTYTDFPKDNVELNFPEKWDQVYPYNLFCPKINGVQCPAGCVATAMGMIMHYWKYPKVGKSQKSFQWPYTQPGSSTIRYENHYVRFSDSSYNYTLMPNSLSRPGTSAEKKQAVSRFLLNVGLSVDMNYTPDGSGAISAYVPSALKKYFKYTNAEYVERRGYTTDAWLAKLKNDIDSGYAIYYAGSDPGGGGRDGGGHAFVCYGYRTVTSGEPSYFAFNWGWGGSGDCYCNVRTSNLTADPYVFSESHDAVFHIVPPADTLNAVEPVVLRKDYLGIAYPNPSNFQVTIPYQMNSNESCDMQILSVDGKLMETRRVNGSETSVILNVSRYPHGVYFYRMKGQTGKFIVQ